MNSGGLLLLLLLISVICLPHLWARNDADIGRKIFWSVVIMFPLFEPLAYWSIFDPPDVSNYRRKWPEDRGGVPPGGATGS